MTIEFHLEGCSSLKEKRKRLSGIRERYGKKINIAVCESGLQNLHQRSEWSFVALSNEKKVVENMLLSIENSLEMQVDALIVNVRREVV